MAINPINSTTIRLSGLSSGLDTDGIVMSMLKTSQLKLDKQNQLTAKLTWKADALREVNSLIRSFRENNLSVLNSANNMLSSAAYDTFSVSMLTATNAVTVSAGASANVGKLTIDSITQLATQAQVKSTGAFAGETINYGTALKDLEFAAAVEFEEGKISFSINGETFEFSEDSTLNDVLNTINSSGAGVKIGYSSLTKGFSITAKTTGSASEVAIVNIAGNAFAAHGLQASESAFGISEGTVNGKNAIMSIENITVERATNSFTIDGITYSLKDTMGASVSFNVDRNLDATVDKIVSFISEYNTLIGKLQDMLGEKTYRAYAPLTDEQKSQMNEKDIQLWEDKAKSGLLRNDSDISLLLSGMRNAFSSVVEGMGISPAALGLNTGFYYEHGKITVDTDKLRAALENNPDMVRNVFIQSPSGEASEKYGRSGLVLRISDALLSYTQKATSNTLVGLDRLINDSKERESTLTDKMVSKESALWRKYSAMEKALSVLYSQQSWMTAMTNTWMNNK
ncbi:MAG: flagellar filament capping protein FliD [Christensenellales bacterium]